MALKVSPATTGLDGWLTTGQETFYRHFVNGGVTTANQSMRLSFFTARKTETATKIRIVTSSTAAGATPTLVRFGLYTVAANGDITLVASTANDTTLLAAATTAYEKALQASYGMVAGTRYAVGLLVVTGAATPTIMGNAAIVTSESALAPRLCAAANGQTDLPSGVVAGSLTNSGNNFWAAVLP